MVVNCDIEFDNNPYGVYFAGQMLTGKISLISDRPKNVTGVALYIHGYAHTSWSESSKNSRGGSDTTWYTGHDDYINSVTYLAGLPSGPMITIEPGIHTYNYSCHIPHHCPSSFEGFHGHVRYVVKVALIRPFKFDQKYSKGFTVLKLMDLNHDTPLLKMPSQVDAQKVFCCGPCSTEPMKITVAMPQTGYVPGQMIPVHVTVNNNTSVPIEEMKISLVMLVRFYSQSPTAGTQVSYIPVAKVKGDGVLRQCNKEFVYNLLVPPTPPTCFNLCRIIQIAYQIEVEAKIKGIMHVNQVVCTPVTIGNVPLMSGPPVIQQQPTFSGPGPRMIEDGNDTGMKEERVVTPATPWDASIPPPSFEEAIHMSHGNINDNDPNDYGQKDFAPRYPVFSMPSPGETTEQTANGAGSTDDAVAPNKSTWL